MRLLLDTHAVIWATNDDPRLGGVARSALSDPANAVSWSAVCSWEIALKYEAGRLLLPTPAAGWVLATRSVLRAELLDVTEAHMLAAAALPRIHGDPFDRLLVAQARAERLVLLSLDDKVRAYDVEVWPPR